MLTKLQVKTVIINISGLHSDPAGLHGSTKLSELAYNEYMRLTLENRLRTLSAKTIAVGAITLSKTVDQIIEIAI